jgi:class 3 adenylate cyclase/cell division protein FtsN
MTTTDPHIRAERDEQLEQHASSLTIVFIDFVGSTVPRGQGSAALQATAWDSELITSIVQKHQGHVIKTLANAIMAEFSHSAAAIRAAMEMERLTESNSQARMRIGIHGLTDQVREIDVFGSVVSMAANITKHAAFGQILVSRQVVEAVSKETDLHCQWFRTVNIGGKAENDEVFEVKWAAAPSSIPPRYEVLSQVGAGGMGIVYKVRDRETDEIVALKILKSALANDPAMQENLRREVCLARKVTHKNVCRIHEFSRSNGTAYISMEFIEGESLLSRLHRCGSFPLNEALTIGQHICAGLREAHVQGIVHRDLKPANIMVDQDGNVKIMDFGIARRFQGTGPITGTLAGTPAYMAPEQVELKRLDARTDIYALGLLLYEIVTGVPAFEGETPIAVALKQLRESPKRPRQVVPSLPGRAETLILKCLQKDPSKRFQSVDDLARALKRLAEPRPTVSPWDAFVADFGRAGRDVQATVQPWVEAAARFAHQQNWKVLTTKRAPRAVAAAVGAACLLGLVAFSLASGPKSGAASIPTEFAALVPIQSSRPTVPETLLFDDTTTLPAQPSEASLSGLPMAGATEPVGAYGVDLGSATKPAEHAELSSILWPAKQPPPAESKVTVVKKDIKTQPAARVSARSIISQRLPPSLVAQVDTPPQPADAPTVPTAIAEASDTQKNEDASSELSESVVPSTPADSVPATNEKTMNATSPTAASDVPGHYLQVGSFKDPTWADHAVTKLTQLGFHAMSLRKGRLWMQSYEVVVGPYADPKDRAVAGQNLVAQGFKPHPIK